MDFTATAIMEPKKTSIKPYSVKNALVGLGLDESDEPMLNYVGFWSEHVPVKKAVFAHVIPTIELFEKRDNGKKEEFQIENKTVKKVTEKIHSRIASKGKVKVSFDVLEGNPLNELLEKAGEHNADLVVIGKAAKKDIHGILAKNFARKVKSNALLVPAQAKPSLKKILVPFDFSPNSIQALRTAIAVSKCFENAPGIIALNIYELPPLQSYVIRRTDEELRALLLEDRQAAFKTYLESWFQEKDRALVKTAILEQTHPGVGSFIIEYAEDIKADLIVMGARGHSKIGLLLLGSVTEKALMLATKTPVLVVKEEEQ
jgi:nucleotide-binding universal stress UspA family protein